MQGIREGGLGRKREIEKSGPLKGQQPYLSPEDGDNMFLRNLSTHLQVHMMLQPRDDRHRRRRQNIRSQQTTASDID
jgi:hypothetical protein